MLIQTLAHPNSGAMAAARSPSNDSQRKQLDALSGLFEEENVTILPPVDNGLAGSVVSETDRLANTYDDACVTTPEEMIASMTNFSRGANRAGAFGGNVAEEQQPGGVRGMDVDGNIEDVSFRDSATEVAEGGEFCSSRKTSVNSSALMRGHSNGSISEISGISGFSNSSNSLGSGNERKHMDDVSNVVHQESFYTE